MSLKRAREDNDETDLANSLASSSTLVSTNDIPSHSTEPPVKRIRQEYDQPGRTFLGSLFSGAFKVMRGVFNKDERNGAPTRSQMRAQRSTQPGGKLPVGARSIRAQPEGILAHLLELDGSRAGEKVTADDVARSTTERTKSEAANGSDAEAKLVERRAPIARSIYPTPESSQESDDHRPPSNLSGPRTVPSRGHTEYSPLLFPPSSHSSFADLTGIAAQETDEVDGTASQPVVVSDDEGEDESGSSTTNAPTKADLLLTLATPTRPPPRRPDLSGHVAPTHHYDWLISSDAGSSTSSGRSRSGSTASLRRKRRASGQMGSPQQRALRQAQMLEHHALELLKQGDGHAAKSFKRELMHAQARVATTRRTGTTSSPGKIINRVWANATKDRGDDKGLYAALLDRPRTLDAMLHKPKSDVFSPEKSMKKADYAKSRTAQIVDDIVENFSKAHLAEEAKIKKALDKTVPAPTRMASARAGEVAAHLRDANFDFRILDKGLRQRDLITLKPTQWLNDEVINTYLTMVRDRSDRAGGADGFKDVYEMSTFFYQKLSQQGYEKAKLARWTKRAKVDIFAKDLILVPVNIGGMHWTAAAINNVARRIEYYDSMGDRGGHRAKVFSNLRQYLREEHQNKKSAPFNEDGWTDHFIAGTPQQDNGSDCGVFTCQTLEALARGRDLTDVSAWDFGHRNMPYIRQMMVLEFGQGKLEKRWPAEQ